jgi:hypothetical protein
MGGDLIGICQRFFARVRAIFLALTFIRFQYEALESRKLEVRKIFIFASVFWNLNTVHSLVSGDKI